MLKKFQMYKTYPDFKHAHLSGIGINEQNQINGYGNIEPIYTTLGIYCGDLRKAFHHPILPLMRVRVVVILSIGG